MAEKQDLLSQALPAAAGAANQVLFGLPEAGLKALSPENRAAIEKWKADNQGYGAGETAGMVGSMFIPYYGLLGKAVNAISAGSKAAQALAKGAQFLKATGGGIGGAAQRGMAEAALQAVPRGVAEAIDTQDPGKAVGSTLAGIGGGAAIGGALGALGKGVGALANTGIGKSVIKAAQDMPVNAVLSGVGATTANVVSRLKKSARRLGIGPHENAFVYGKVEDFKKGYNDWLLGKNSQGKNLQSAAARDEYLGDTSDTWNRIAAEYDNNPLDFHDPNIMGQIIADEDVARELFSAAITKRQQQLIVKTLVEDIAKRPTFNDKKYYLNNIVAQMRRKEYAGTAEQSHKAMEELAGAMEDAMDSHLSKISPEFSAMRAEYPFVKYTKDLYQPKADITNPSTSNSLTQPRQAVERFITGVATGGGSAAGGPLGGVLGGLFAPLVQGGIAKGVTQGAARLGGAVQSPGFQKLAAMIPQSAGGIAERAPGVAVGQNVPEIPTEYNPDMPEIGAIPISDTGEVGPDPEAEKKAKQRELLEQGIQRVIETYDKTGINRQYKKDWAKNIHDGIIANVVDENGNIDYLRASKVLFGDEEARKKFVESYTKYKPLIDALPAALAPMGTFQIPGLQPNEMEQYKIGAENVLTKILMEGLNHYNEPTARSIIRGIIHNPLKIDPEQKKAEIMDILNRNDPSFKNDIGVLARMGVTF